MKEPKIVEVKYHFSKREKKCNGDYHFADVWFDGIGVWSLGSYYDDKSDKQIEGFLYACELIWGKDFLKKVKTLNINDSDIDE